MSRTSEGTTSSQRILKDVAELKRLAEAATPGPWIRLFGERTVYDRMEDGCRGVPIVRADLGYGKQDAANLDFIAHANPAAILELLAQRDELLAALTLIRDAENSALDLAYCKGIARAAIAKMKP